jgi:hypothetical protein
MSKDAYLDVTMGDGQPPSLVATTGDTIVPLGEMVVSSDVLLLDHLIGTATEQLQEFQADLPEMGDALMSEDPMSWMGGPGVPTNTPKVIKATIAPPEGLVPPYKLVATTEGLSLHVRWIKSNGALSIRISGPAVGEESALFKKIGLVVKDDLAAIHVETKDLLLARKTVGSVLAACHVDWDVDWSLGMGPVE